MEAPQRDTDGFCELCGEALFGDEPGLTERFEMTGYLMCSECLERQMDDAPECAEVFIGTFCEKLAPRVRFKGVIAKPTLMDHLGEVVTHPAVVVYSRVAFSGMVGLCGLLSVVVAMGALS